VCTGKPFQQQVKGAPVQFQVYHCPGNPVHPEKVGFVNPVPLVRFKRISGDLNPTNPFRLKLHHLLMFRIEGIQIFHIDAETNRVGYPVQDRIAAG
jgi:hypothetical protein